MQLTPAYNTINDLHIINPDMVWGISNVFRTDWTSSPSVVKTINGGNDWISIPIKAIGERHVFDIHAFDDQKAFITTNNLINDTELLKTEDGGNSWISSNTSPACGGYVHFFNELEGLVINSNLIEITEDGGETWTSANYSNNIVIGDIYNKNFSRDNLTESRDNSFWYLTRNSKLIRSIDKGQNWEVFNTPEVFWSIAMKDEMNGLAVAIDYTTYVTASRIYSTTDGGQTWTLTSLLDNGFTIFTLEYIEGSNAYLGTEILNSSTSFTIDDGASWEFIEDALLTGIAKFHDPNTGWVVRSVNYQGYTPVIYKWGGDPFPELVVNTNDIESISNIEAFPNPFSKNLSLAFDNSTHEEASIELLDIKGQVLQHFLTTEDTYIINNLSNISSGTYFVRIIIGNKLKTLKIFKQ